MNKKIILILIIGLFLRLLFLGDYSLWLDEIISIDNSQGAHLAQVDEILNQNLVHKESNNLQGAFQANLIDDGGNGLLHMTLLRYWSLLGGNHPFYLRLLEVLIFVLSFFAFFRLLKDHFSEKIIPICLFIFSIHPLLLAHNREVRTYSLAILVSILLVNYTLKIIKKWSLKNLILLTVLSIVALFTHFLMASVLFALFITVIWFKPNLRYMLSLGALVVSFVSIFTIWYTNGGQEGISGMQVRSENYAEMAKTNDSSIPTAANIIKGSGDMLIPLTGNLLKQTGMRNRVALFASIPLFFFLMYGLYLVSKRLSYLKKPPYFLLTVLCLSPFLLATFSAINAGHITSFLPRYCSWIIPFFVIILALILSKSNTLLPKVAFYSSLLIMFASDFIVIQDYERNRISNKSTLSELSLHKNTISSITFFNERSCLTLNLFIDLPADIEQKIDTTLHSEISILTVANEAIKLPYELKNQP